MVDSHMANFTYPHKYHVYNRSVYVFAFKEDLYLLSQQIDWQEVDEEEIGFDYSFLGDIVLAFALN